MIFNKRLELADKHALLSPSNYHWINYTDQKLEARYIAAQAAKLGTDLHEFAHEAIRLRIELPDTDATINMYVNDGIAFRMQSEVCLYYSDNCFGHADNISFRDNLLQISDLKTGITKASMTQLKVYAALFCLEYAVSPFEIDIELRIYQNNAIELLVPNAEEIAELMDTIIYSDKMIESFKEEGE